MDEDQSGEGGIPIASIRERCTARYVSQCSRELSERHGLPAAYGDMVERLCKDRRMGPFWEWYQSAPKEQIHSMASGRFLAVQWWHSTQMPWKPGNLSPALRKRYFEQVTKHAEELISLLRDTIFDRRIAARISEEDLASTVDQFLCDHRPRDDEESHFLTIEVDRDGAKLHDAAFTEGALTSTLQRLIAWTRESDHWDGMVFSTSDPIVQPNSARTPALYFTCTLFDWFQSRRLPIPFPLLATVTNVALDVPAETQLDEETVRKQVRRYHARTHGDRDK